MEPRLHWRRDVRQWLMGQFPNWTIVIGIHIDWPARIPDLASCDLFLWGYFEEWVYVQRPFDSRDVSHQYENDNDNGHVITLWVRASKSWRHFRQTSSWRSKRTWFCWFASICGHFPLANAVQFDYLKNIDDVFVIVIVFVLVRNLPNLEDLNEQ
jgi:hypothetical protein